MKIVSLLAVSLTAAALTLRAGASPAPDATAVPARLSVAGSADVRAVLLPPVDVKRLFGAEVARRYAVVAVTVSNRSADAALLVQGAYLDTTQWALAGAHDSSATQARQIASVEARLVRGQLLDAQQWSARNWTIRLLSAAGAAASGYSFAFSGTGAAQGIAAFNGTLIPGLSSVWPDGATQQLNRLSDFGLQLNKVIPKQSADLVICFFPIDRFLTPAFQHLYRKSPAAFFAPFQLLFDRQMEKDLKQALGPLLDSANLPVNTLRRAVPDYLAGQPLDPKTSQMLNFLSHLSLQAVTVVVEGVFAIDTSALAPQVKTGRLPQTAAGAMVRGSVSGAYLTGAEVELSEAGDYGAKVQTLTQESSDNQLSFQVTASKVIPTGAAVHLVVRKTNVAPASLSVIVAGN